MVRDGQGVGHRVPGINELRTGRLADLHVRDRVLRLVRVRGHVTDGLGLEGWVSGAGGLEVDPVESQGALGHGAHNFDVVRPWVCARSDLHLGDRVALQVVPAVGPSPIRLNGLQIEGRARVAGMPQGVSKLDVRAGRSPEYRSTPWAQPGCKRRWKRVSLRVGHPDRRGNGIHAGEIAVALDAEAPQRAPEQQTARQPPSRQGLGGHTRGQLDHATVARVGGVLEIQRVVEEPVTRNKGCGLRRNGRDVVVVGRNQGLPLSARVRWQHLGHLVRQ